MSALTRYWVRRNRLQQSPDEIRPEDYVQVYVSAHVDAAQRVDIEELRGKLIMRQGELIDRNTQLFEAQARCDEKSETIARDTIRFVDGTKRAIELAGGGTSWENAVELLASQLAMAQAKLDAEEQCTFDLTVDRDKAWAETKNLQRQLAEAMSLLRELADLQNGAPLPKYEQEWEACMLNVHKVLTAFEATPEPPRGCE